MRYGRIAWVIPVVSLLAAPTGESLYLSQCAVCHGGGGEGGRGPSLGRPALRRAPDDEALFRVIRRGIPNSGMPATAFAEREIRLVMGFVRALGRAAAAPALPGDARRGEQIYSGKGNCAGCHQAAGPELAGIGARRSAAYIRKSLTDPGADTPDGFVWMEAETKEGRKVTGSRVNEDTFSLQLRDANGEMHSYWKSELRTFGRVTGRSPMPSYRGVLSDGELDDLTAYLAGRVEAER